MSHVPRVHHSIDPGEALFAIARWSESVDVLRELSHARRRKLCHSCDSNSAFAATLVEFARHLSWCHAGGQTGRPSLG